MSCHSHTCVFCNNPITPGLRHHCPNMPLPIPDFLRNQQNLQAEQLEAELNPAICIGCGCDDLHACEDALGDPCYWLRLDRKAGKGVCSECPEYVEQWDKGLRDL